MNINEFLTRAEVVNALAIIAFVMVFVIFRRSINK